MVYRLCTNGCKVKSGHYIKNSKMLLYIDRGEWRSHFGVQVFYELKRSFIISSFSLSIYLDFQGLGVSENGVGPTLLHLLLLLFWAFFSPIEPPQRAGTFEGRNEVSLQFEEAQSNTKTVYQQRATLSLIRGKGLVNTTKFGLSLQALSMSFVNITCSHFGDPFVTTATIICKPNV